MYYILGTGGLLYDVDVGMMETQDRHVLLKKTGMEVGALYHFCDYSALPEDDLGHPLILAVASKWFFAPTVYTKHYSKGSKYTGGKGNKAKIPALLTELFF